MGAKSSIEWTDSTWSALRARVRHDAGEIALQKGYSSLVEIGSKMAGRVGQHCEHVSDGCKFCYSGTWQSRCLPVNGTGLPFDRRSRDLIESIVDEQALALPLRWRSVRVHAERCGKTALGKRAACTCSGDDKHRIRPLRIFVENQSDLFGEWVTDDQIDRVFAVMALCPHHTFQVLTKRPERMLAYLKNERESWIAQEIERRKWKPRIDWDASDVQNLEHWPLLNVWLGVSVENQPTADARVPLLLQTPAAKRFISYEPALGPVDFATAGALGCACESDEQCSGACRFYRNSVDNRRLDWIIAGGESGPGARPADPAWFRSVRDQCEESGVPFFFKQWGDWLPPMCDGALIEGQPQEINSSDAPIRVGKKKAGALLDGREHREFTSDGIKTAGETP